MTDTAATDTDTGAPPGLELRRDGGIQWIVLDRDERANSLTPAMRNAIIATLAAAHADADVRAVVLTANGKRFCSGADVSGGSATELAPGDVAELLRSGAQALVSAVLDCSKPVICGVNGTAAGIGAHLVLACDLVIAARSAKLIEVFCRRGLVPDGGGTWLLPRLVGPQKAKELLFLAEDVSADEAERIGLVNKVVDDDALGKEVAALAERIANGPTRAYAFTKQLVNRAFETPRDVHLALEGQYVEMNVRSHDQTEGITAFFEKRPPKFTGR